jgi:hypothetical protein
VEALTGSPAIPVRFAERWQFTHHPMLKLATWRMRSIVSTGPWQVWHF